MQSPDFGFMEHCFSIRERELNLLKDEYAFLQACGGITSDDMAHFRASVLRHTRPPPVTIRIKEEEEPPKSSDSPIVSLKSMLLDIITHDQADNINKICRHVRPLLDRDGIRTFTRHHATHVRLADVARVRELMQKEGMVV
jgi:hypothetical protein